METTTISKEPNLPDVLMIGTGEYTTGFVQGSSSGSDKKIGVVALVFFDLKSPHRGPKINKVIFLID